jgi:hypothetical protein
MESEKQQNLTLPLGGSNEQGEALNEGLQRRAAELKEIKADQQKATK